MRTAKNYIQIKTTFTNMVGAIKLSELILEAGLVACGQISEIHSIYNFEGKTHNHLEFLLAMKTREELYDECEAFIKLHHPYKVPQIIAVKIEQGSADYFDWITQNTKAD